MLKDAINNALGHIASWFIIYYGYYWAKVLLSLWIEENHSAYTIKGKFMSIVFCILGAAIIASAIGLIMKETTTAFTVFIILFPTALIAAYNLYKHFQPKRL
jgi:hypothetical protein